MSEEHERLYEEAQRRMRELMTLYEASQACLSISDQKGLLTAIIEAAARATDAALGSVMLIDKERGEYVFGAHYGLSQETITAVEAELHIPLGEGLAGTVVTTSRPVVVTDVTTDPRWIPIETNEPIRSFLGVPLVGRDGRSLGALTLFHPETDAFDDDDARLLSTFANQAAMAIENARLYEQAQARSRYLETLQRINATLRSTLPLSQVLETIAQGAGEALNYVGSLILMPDATGERLTLGAVWGSRFLDAAVRLTGLEVGSFSLPLTANENPMARAYLRGELQAWSGEPERIVVGVEPPISPKLAPVIERVMGAKLAVCVSLPVGEKVVGVLVVFSPREQLPDEERAMLLGLADQAGLAIENAQLYEQAQHEIAERQEAIRALRESEERYRRLLELSFDVIAIHREGRIVYINAAGAELFGASSPEEVIGKTLLDFVHPDYSEIAKARMLQTSNGTIAPLIEEKLIRLDKTSVDTEVVEVPITYQGQPAVQVVARDITERKRMEEALAQERDLLHALMDNIPDTIYFKDTTSRFTRINRAQAQVLGLDDPKEAMGKTDFDFFTAGHAQDAHADEQGIVRSGQPLVDKVEQIRRADGQFRWVSATKVPIIDKEEQVTGIVGISRDITERKRAEEALAEERNLLRTLIDNLPHLIYIKDTESRFVIANNATAQFMGVSPDELIGRTDFDFYPQELAMQFYADEQAIIESGQPLISKDEPNVDQAGNKRWLLTTKVPLRDSEGEIIGIVGIGRNITERKRAEEELRRLKEFNEGMVQSMTEGIIVENAEGCLTFVNPSAAALLGYNTPDELLGQHWTVVVPSDQQPIIQAAHERRAGGEADRDDVELIRRDGTRVSVLISGSPRFEEGRFAGTLAVFTDITERKQLEAQLRQAQKMEAVGTLAGGIAHDFNNLLTSILGFASVVHSELPADSPLRFDIETIIHSARRGSELTRQLLAFARRNQVEVHPLSLNDVAREVIKLLERTIDKAIAIEPHLTDDLPIVEGDAGQLHQMLLNLCLNARDAMPQGGQLIIETQNVTLSEEKTHTELNLEAGQYVLLSVTDTGIGMDAETQQHLFEPFFTTKEHGRGLGLAMVYGIVRGHGGAIHVYSEPSQGSTFKVYLPVAGRVTEDTVPEQVKALGGSETVLVVEDEESVRALLRRILEEGGYTVLLAANGVEAVERYAERSTEIDLVVLDIIMPQMGGRETYERLREINPEVKVLLSSGYSENGQAQDILAAGARGFLQKPYDLRAVLHNVREALDS